MQGRHSWNVNSESNAALLKISQLPNFVKLHAKQGKKNKNIIELYMFKQKNYTIIIHTTDSHFWNDFFWIPSKISISTSHSLPFHQLQSPFSRYLLHRRWLWRFRFPTSTQSCKPLIQTLSISSLKTYQTHWTRRLLDFQNVDIWRDGSRFSEGIHSWY